MFDARFLTVGDAGVSYDDTKDTSFEEAQRSLVGGQAFDSLDDAFDDVKKRLTSEP